MGRRSGPGARRADGSGQPGGGLFPGGGSNTGTAACRAAIAANGAPFTAWDNLRVAGVGGRDRQVIPDGQLCSGGLPAYKGLNLARADWPSTRMTPGATFTLSYSSTIPHTGTFKLYLSKPGYDPTKPLKWSDLPTKPFATATDPALVNGAYRIKATLPSDRTGRQMLYTIWQNTSTSDTYYSCSDVVFPAASGGGAAAPTTSSPARTTPTANRTAQRSQEPTATTATPATGRRRPPGDHRGDDGGDRARPSAPAADSSSGGSNTLPSSPGRGAVAFLLTAGVAITLRRRR
ncbi:lytic polysaccharide monooxygenase [Streptomyces mirabilis]|nr:lytic polysaccharide monooxygenase [Streptomyces mirabilis]